ncbi:hypothetical protein [Massilia sp. DWR3-1-1]|uniref:hypothetical protein n=1 Tax=Massilia sp. DWR3-1-1 TaxID=2804559 RepID=UPI003CEC1B08
MASSQRRQAWLVAGQHFPDPQRDWMLDVVADDAVGVDICPPAARREIGQAAL